MRIAMSILYFVIFSFSVFGQTRKIDNQISLVSLKTEWQNAGCPESVIIEEADYDTILTVNAWYYNAIKPTLDNAKDYMQRHPDSRCLVKFPAGVYNIHRPIVLNSDYSGITLMGVNTPGGVRATLNFWFDTQWPDSNYFDSYSRVHSLIRLNNVTNFGIVNFEITADSFAAVYNSNTRIRENLFHNIQFANNSSKCWVENVHSIKPLKNHLVIWQNSNHITVRNCTFEQSYEYGEGGRAYGVHINSGANRNLVENNIFSTLRHAMIVSDQADYNVFGYNFSNNQTDEINNTLGDICLHGVADSNFSPSKYNLFEGNYVERIRADMYHGTNGPDNYMVRNFVSDGKITIEAERDSNTSDSKTGTFGVGDNSYHILGNKGETEYLKYTMPIDDTVTVITSFSQPPSVTEDKYTTYPLRNHMGNNSSLAGQINVISYYYNNKPSFIAGYTWPCIGPSHVIPYIDLSQNIPARTRAISEGFENPTIRIEKKENTEITIEDFELDQNYPNPFNPTTNIRFALPVSGNVNLKIYNMLGQEVITLVNGQYEAGNHEVKVDASSFSSGVYIYSLSVEGKDGSSFRNIKKMMLLK